VKIIRFTLISGLFSIKKENFFIRKFKEYSAKIKTIMTTRRHKRGTLMIVREINVSDAEGFTHLIKEVEANSDFMLMEPGERQITPERQAKALERITQDSHSTIFVAEEEGQLIGYLIAIGGDVKRKRHSAYLVVGILKAFRGKGIGTALFQSLDRWAREHQIRRLELTTVIQNVAGVALYKKNGFEIEGIKRESLMIDNEPYDEYYMAKLL